MTLRLALGARRMAARGTHHPPASRGRDPRLGHGPRHRQDRHPHRGPDGRSERLWTPSARRRSPGVGYGPDGRGPVDRAGDGRPPRPHRRCCRAAALCNDASLAAARRRRPRLDRRRGPHRGRPARRRLQAPPRPRDRRARHPTGRRGPVRQRAPPDEHAARSSPTAALPAHLQGRARGVLPRGRGAGSPTPSPYVVPHDSRPTAPPMPATACSPSPSACAEQPARRPRRGRDRPAAARAWSRSPTRRGRPPPPRSPPAGRPASGPVLITGDHPATARPSPADSASPTRRRAVTGDELPAPSVGTDLDPAGVHVFARTSPSRSSTSSRPCATAGARRGHDRRRRQRRPRPAAGGHRRRHGRPRHRGRPAGRRPRAGRRRARHGRHGGRGGAPGLCERPPLPALRPRRRRRRDRRHAGRARWSACRCRCCRPRSCGSTC